ncbi:MAG TPA: ABC transporter ATP-binding protein [Rhodothermales bacterium]|nr:ABC transporter ATP-binding protein [Rhodothermales bacterium]
MARPDSLKTAAPSLLSLVRHLAPYLRKHRWMTIGSTAGLLLTAVMRALEPWPLKFVFDYIFANSTPGEFLGVDWSAVSEGALLALAASALVAIIGIRALVDYYYRVGFALVGNRVLTKVRATLYQHMQRLSLAYHNRSRAGDLIVRVTGDIGLLKDVAVTALMPLVASIFMLVLMAALMFWMNWQLTLLVVAVAPLYWFPTLRLGRKIRTASRQQRKREGSLASNASEVLTSMQVVQTLSLEETFSGSFTRANERSLKEGVKIKRLTAKMESTVRLMTGLSSGLILWAGAMFVIRGELSPGDLLVFLSYLKTAFRPMQDLSKYSARISKASAAAERVIEVLDTEPDVRDLPHAAPAPAFRGDVEFENVTFEYEPGEPVLRNVSFSVEAGRKVALVGPSGAGKSTIVCLIPRLYDVAAGRILVDGKDVRDYTLESLRRQISFVLQDTVLFASSILDNIAYGADDVSEEMVREAARLANIEGFIDELPEGFDTMVGERGVTLSAGQRQRIAIARAAVRNAPILILDEPTTGLDVANQTAVMNALERLSRGRTTFFITHDQDQVIGADLVLFVDDHTILESGSPRELKAANGPFARLFGPKGDFKRTQESKVSI